jgi:dethiobiotin synthetase
MKPAETGCALRNNTLYPEDAARLAAFSRSTLTLEEICPYRFAPPVAPSVAATQAGTRIDPADLTARYQDIAARSDFMIVEGAGGLLVPLVNRYTFADLAQALGLSLLVVVGSKLGALNHTMLTLRYAQMQGLPVIGYIVNHPTEGADDATQTNGQTLAQLTDLPCLGVVPFLRLCDDIERDRSMLQNIFMRTVDFTALLR